MRIHYHFVFFATIFFSTMGHADPATVYLRNDEPPVVAITITEKETPICLKSFDYNREDRMIGHLKNGYGVPSDSVYAENSVEQWVNTGIRMGATVQGYSLQSDCDKNALIVSGEIERVYASSFPGTQGEVVLEVNYVQDTVSIRKEYTGYARSEKRSLLGVRGFPHILNEALTAATTQLIHDLNHIDSTGYPGWLETTAHSASGGTLSNETFVHSDSSGTILGREAEQCPRKHGEIQILNGARSYRRVRLVLDSVTRDMNRLYQSRFDLDETISGRLCLRFTILENGQTENIRIIRNTLQDLPLTQMVREQLSRKNFNISDRERDRCEVSYSLAYDADRFGRRRKVASVIAGVTLLLSFVIGALVTP